MATSQQRSSANDVRIIDDLETLRLLTQPVRLRIVEALRSALEPLTVKELAARLRASQTKLYYHVKLLEGAGLIRVASTRLVSGIPEKRYVAADYRIGVDRALLAPGTSGEDGLEVLLSVILDQVRTEIRRSARAGLIDLERSRDDDDSPSSLLLGRKWLRLTPEQAVEFRRRILAVQNDYFSQDARPGEFKPDAPPNSRLYELLLGFYPAVSSTKRDGPDAPEAPMQNTPSH